jgi:hypothetical protein
MRDIIIYPKSTDIAPHTACNLGVCDSEDCTLPVPMLLTPTRTQVHRLSQQTPASDWILRETNVSTCIWHPSATSVWVLKLLVYETLSYYCMRHQATSVWGLKLLVHVASIY